MKNKLDSKFEISLLNYNKNKNLNAFINLNEDLVRKQLEKSKRRFEKGNPRKLEGIFITVKDNIHVAGLTNTAGTKALNKFIPDTDSPIIQKLKSEGAIIFGKTNMHELAFGISSYNHAFYNKEIGVRNAYNPKMIAGGSSGGTASAIGAKIVNAGLGTDTGGSMRIPAALNGVVGFRPTVGRYSQEGVTPLSSTRDTVGPMGRDVETTAKIDSVITDEKHTLGETNTKEITLGIAKEFLQNLTPDVGTLWNETISKLKSAGIKLVEIDCSEIFKLNALVSFPVVMYESKATMIDYLKKYNLGFSIEDLAKEIVSPDVAETYKSLVIPEKLPTENGLIDTKPLYEEAINIHRPNLIKEYDKIFTENKLDGIIFPTTPSTAIEANPESSNPEIFGKFIQNTDPASNAGIPGISIPMGITSKNLPAGIEIDSFKNNDSKLLSIAYEIEKILK